MELRVHRSKRRKSQVVLFPAASASEITCVVSARALNSTNSFTHFRPLLTLRPCSNAAGQCFPTFLLEWNPLNGFVFFAVPKCSDTSVVRRTVHGLRRTCPLSTSLFSQMIPEIDANPEHKRLNLYTRALLLLRTRGIRDTCRVVTCCNK